MADGHFHARLVEAVDRSGTPRSVYSQDTTLSRRGLLTRAERRARELAGMGVGPRDLVALSMGNVAEFLILLVALSKLDAVAMPVDPANGDGTLLRATERLPVRAVIRRPRGLETAALDYPAGYSVRSRKRLTSSLLTVDILEPPEAFRPLLGSVGLDLHLAEMRTHHLAQAGQMGVVALAPEQRAAQLVLQRLDGARQRRLDRKSVV